MHIDSNLGVDFFFKVMKKNKQIEFKVLTSNLYFREKIKELSNVKVV